MIHPILHRKLSEIIEARHALRLRWANGWLLLVVALGLAAWALVPATAAVSLFKVIPGVVVSLFIGALMAKWYAARHRPDTLSLVREIEAYHPELNARLRTAIEQEPQGGGFTYLQQRVIDEAVHAAARSLWSDELTEADARRSRAYSLAATLALSAAFLLYMQQHQKVVLVGLPHAKDKATERQPAPPKAEAFDISVTPGDAEVERGSKLVVEAKFKTDVPADATLVVSDGQGKERERLPMHLTVDSKVFGGMVANLNADGLYHVEYADGKTSPSYKISTFVYPELDHADAKITPPGYTKQPAREIKNTLKVTMMEGSDLGYRFKINKPIQDAELFGEDKSIIPLKPSADDPTTLVAAWKPDASRKYRLHLVDDHERANKQPPWLTINVLKNQPPRIEVAFPKRDAKVSVLQELPLEARLWDDVAVQKAGAVIDIAEQPRDVALPLAGLVPDLKTSKLTVKTLLNMEHETVEPQQLVSYYFWAEDTGPDGKPRRSMSDMFFAEVRDFDAAYREKEPPPPSDEPGEKKPGAKLLEQQKQIVNATWKLVRDAGAGRDMKLMRQDIDTVMTSQAINDEAVNEALAKEDDPRRKAMLLAAQKQMKLAVQQLSPASESAKADALTAGLKPEQAALRQLFQLQSSDKNITRADPKAKGKGEQEEKEREMLELELKQKEQRYEEEKQASAEKTKEQQENLAVLSRLKELARREEALIEKMKELEQQLAQAKTEAQKSELANQLKRLQDEQEQLLRDVDDLRERMDKAENQAQLAEAKKQLDETREKVADAQEQLKQEKLSQAQASATRAQKELEQARDDLRLKTAKRFAEELKSMRDEARDLATEEQKLANTLEGRPETSSNASDSAAALKHNLGAMQTARDITEQRARAAQLMDKMKTVSEQAEGTEPLLHKHLYEALRQAHTLGLDEQLGAASDLARMGRSDQAQNAERQAAKAVEELQKGVERAAEGVLGSESEALRMAKVELDKLIHDIGDVESNEGRVKPTAPSRKADENKGTPGGNASDKSEATTGPSSTEPQVANAEGQSKSSQGQSPGELGKTPAGAKGMAANGEPKDGEGQPKPGADGKPTGQEGKGQQPGTQPGEGQDKGKQQANAPGKGEGEGEREGKGEQPGRGQQQANAPGKGNGEGQGEQPGQGQDQGQSKGQGQSSRNSSGGVASGGSDDRGDHRLAGGGNKGGNFFDEATQADDKSPLTGAGFEPWTDRLRNVEDALTHPALRNEAAKVLDEARAIRVDARRNNAAPQAEHVQTRIIAPLVELRDRVAEALALKEAKNPMLPVDHDPVPERYRVLVQKYYEQLGKGN